MISDPDQYHADTAEQLALDPDFQTPNDMLFDRRCCENCRKVIKSQRRPFKFDGYSSINTRRITSLKNHQYFLCDYSAVAYVLKQRKWSTTPVLKPHTFVTNKRVGDLEVTGFRPAKYDKSMLDTLV